MGLRLDIVAPTDDAIARAADLIRTGALVALPTETVYGLGGDATNDRAVAGIFQAKGRPQFNPLIAHVPDAAAAAQHVVWTDVAEVLAQRFWPGPLTLVLSRRADCAVSLLCSAGLDTLAVRSPSHPVAQALLRAVGRPVAAPSANRSGMVSPTQAAHVVQSLGAGVALVLDGGRCPVGVESTVIDLTAAQPTLLRPGGATREAIEAVIGPLARAPAVGTPGALHAPGQLESHYAPALPVRLDALSVADDEALLAFGPDVPGGAALTLNLSPAGDMGEAAANLFAMLRTLDRPDLRGIAVAPIPDHGLGLAINDRLRRAAAPRP
ncbi:L-threonylcarbamoyladenylate synthase [Reyranella sp. CPCC 100927]|uniref:L-threonylcarbamoyladenylate synthase n=1 Tax=Reyranella sp. CPCC 100927 TaxID=2599616 RepID=UPI0011B7E4ED|nr:L-threonylcarbamoyladenylate synthase [Reyranella sp. CPCC 100927]TWT15842.1 threonylcarbamoyl-AMP synthase [Reyranella sp. CPCC 100927]